MPHLGDICHIFTFGGTYVIYSHSVGHWSHLHILVGPWSVWFGLGQSKRNSLVVVAGQLLNPVHPFFFGSDELNPSCIVLRHTQQSLLVYAYLCLGVFFVEAHISPLIYALGILSGLTISLVFSPLIFSCVLVKFPHSQLFWYMYQVQ